MTKARELAELGAVYDSGALSNRNLIINGAMQVAQRGTSATVTTAGNSYDALDRFESYRNSSYAPNFTISQDTTGPAGFSRSLKVDVDATATPTGSENFGIRYKVEGSDAAQTGLGTSGSKQITLSFYVKSNKTGTYGTQVFRNGSSTYSTTKGYTIDAADTWERKEITYTALTTDNTPTVTTTWGIMIHFDLSSGPDDQVAEFNWTAQGSARTVTGQVNLMDSTSNYWQITGVQLEVGTEATPFEHRSYGNELARCQRYYQVLSNVLSDLVGASVKWSSGNNFIFCDLANEMRATPSLDTNVSTVSAALRLQAAGYSATGNNLQLDGDSSPRKLRLNSTVDNSSLSNGYGGWLRVNDSSIYVNVSAEL